MAYLEDALRTARSPPSHQCVLAAQIKNHHRHPDVNSPEDHRSQGLALLKPVGPKGCMMCEMSFQINQWAIRLRIMVFAGATGH